MLVQPAQHAFAVCEINRRACGVPDVEQQIMARIKAQKMANRPTYYACVRHDQNHVGGILCQPLSGPVYPGQKTANRLAAWEREIV